MGVNLGANRDSADRAADYVDALRAVAEVADFVSVNVSSPNTAGLRGLQGREALARAAGGRDGGARRTPAPGAAQDRARPRRGGNRGRRRGGDSPRAWTGSSPPTRRSRARASRGGTPRRPAGSRARPCSSARRACWRGSRRRRGAGCRWWAWAAWALPSRSTPRSARAPARCSSTPGSSTAGSLSSAEIAHGLDALLARDGFASVAEAVGTDRDRWL